MYDLGEEHVLEFMYFEGTLYTYIDGDLVYEVANVGNCAFSFTELFACSYGGNNANFNAKGEVDYLRIAVLPKQ